MSKYEKWYKNIIERAKIRKLDGYFEVHHIIPLCVGGSDEKENLVELTAEEHYVCHQLLIKIYPNNRKIVFAAHMMSLCCPDQTRSKNKMYSWLRKKLSEALCSQRKNSAWINKNGVVKWVSLELLPNFLKDGWIRGRGKEVFSREEIEKTQKIRRDKYEKCVKDYYDNPLRCSFCQDILEYDNKKAREKRLKNCSGFIRCDKPSCKAEMAKECAAKRRKIAPPKELSYSDCQCCGKKTKGKDRKFCSPQCNLKIQNEKKRKVSA